MPNCGSQVILCDIPIRFDTYNGCSHMCAYCFVKNKGKGDLTDIKVNEGPKALRAFIEGKRTADTRWCDWNIPLHWGGISDPFQPCEAKYRNSYECLKVFAETGYPFVFSTKGRLVAEPEYLALLRQCNVVAQISAVCDKYDRIEPGAPPFAERVDMMRRLAPNVRRLIVRIQPYMHEVKPDVLANLEKFAEAGAYGVIIEGMKFEKKKPGLIKAGGDFVYPYKVLEEDFREISQKAHKLGLKCYAGENRLRVNGYGDSLLCCGCDGLEGFRGNNFNLVHIANGENPEPTPVQTEKATGECFHSLYQTTEAGRFCRQQSFADMMSLQVREGRIKGLGIVKK